MLEGYSISWQGCFHVVEIRDMLHFPTGCSYQGIIYWVLECDLLDVSVVC